MFPDSLPLLQLPGFSLRQMQLTDASAWYDYLCLPAVWQHTSWNVQQAEDLLPSLQAFASNLPDAPRRFSVIDNSSGRLAGTVGFHTVSALNRTAELAYDFHPDYWGRGLATAAAQAALHWALQEGHLHRVQATVLPSNLASIRVIEKAGMQFEGLLRNFRMVRGISKDFRLYASVFDADAKQS
jgi:RimJ/RimL family protein N-acetyltransferase